MSLPCSFSSSSLLTVPGAFFSAVARACAMVIFGLAVVSDANAPRATTLARVTAVMSFLIIRILLWSCTTSLQTRCKRMSLHEFKVNARLLRKASRSSSCTARDKDGVRSAERKRARHHAAQILHCPPLAGNVVEVALGIGNREVRGRGDGVAAQ